MRYVTQINASGHNDPTAETLAQTIVMLAKQGERDPVRLEQRAIEIMSDQSPDLARSTSRVYVERSSSSGLCLASDEVINSRSPADAPYSHEPWLRY